MSNFIRLAQTCFVLLLLGEFQKTNKGKEETNEGKQNFSFLDDAFW